MQDLESTTMVEEKKVYCRYCGFYRNESEVKKTIKIINGHRQSMIKCNSCRSKKPKGRR